MKMYVIFIVCLCVVAYGGFAKTIRVPGDYGLIQEAIDAAQSGDEILLGPHLFKSMSLHNSDIGWEGGWPNLYTLVINKNLIIRGSGISQTYLDGNRHGSSIIIGANAQVTIEDLTIRQIASYETTFVIKDNAKVRFNNVVFSIERFTVEGESEVYAQSARFTKEGRSAVCAVREEAMLHLTGCILDGVKGIYVYDDSKLYVDQSEVICEWYAIDVSDRGQAELNNSQISGDIAIGVGGKAVIKNCFVKTEIRVYGGSVEITHSNISGIAGLNVRNSGTATVKDSTFSGNGTGIHATESSQITVESCTISDNGKYGISLSGAHAVITNCSVNNNGSDTTGAGINLADEATALITGCVINDNGGWGIRAAHSSVAIGWENSLSGNPRDLYGVSQLLTKSEPLENRSSVAVPQDVPTLQEAVYIVSEGGTIDIAAGVYTAQERLGIYKSVTLRGAGPEQTELSKLGISIFPDVERVTLSNCAVSGEGEQTGLVVGGSVQVHIEDCTFSYWGTGISARDSGQVALIRSIVSNSRWVGIRAAGDASLDVNESRISDNATGGIYFSGSSIMIDHCHITGNGSWCSDTQQFGIEVSGASQVNISYSEISQNVCGGIYIYYYGADRTVPEANINHNKIFANEYGIGLYCQGGSPRITLSHNEIFANKRGIELGIDPGNNTIRCEIYGSANDIHDNKTDLRPSPADFPWPAGFESPFVADAISPTCVMQLRQQANTSQIEEIDVGQSFDICVGDSTDDTGIEGVRFSSDESQDGSPAGEWTEWYDWDTSSGDWNAETKTMVWIFTTSGEKEVWATVRDEATQTSQCYAPILCKSE